MPLRAGRRDREEFVAAICDDCAWPDDAEAPAGPILLLAAAAIAAATVWVSSAPGSPSRLVSLTAAAVWALMVLAYGIRAFRAGWTTRRRGLAGLRSWRWAVPPLLGALTALLVLTDVPVRARFSVSRGAIEHAVDEANRAAPAPSRVGAFAGVTVTSAAGVTAVRVSGECGFFKVDVPGTTLPALGRPVDVGGGWRAGCLPVTS